VASQTGSGPSARARRMLTKHTPVRRPFLSLAIDRTGLGNRKSLCSTGFRYALSRAWLVVKILRPTFHAVEFRGRAALASRFSAEIWERVDTRKPLDSVFGALLGLRAYLCPGVIAVVAS
jgi:hypothetical protein